MILSVERSRSTKDCKEIIISIVATSRSEKIRRRDKILNFETLIADTKNHEPRSKFDHKKFRQERLYKEIFERQVLGSFIAMSRCRNQM